MKILSHKEQLRIRLNDIDVTIEGLESDRSEAFKRLKILTAWGIHFFYKDSQITKAEDVVNRLNASISLLREYRDIISDRLIRAN